MKNASNYSNNGPARYQSRGSLKLNVYVIARSRGKVQYHMGQDDTNGCAEESQGGIYTLPVKQFDARYAPVR